VNFGAARPDRFPKNSFSGQCFADLGDALTGVTECATALDQSRNALRANRKVRDEARENLYRQLRRISVTAVAIGLDASGVEAGFRLPQIRTNAALLHTARTFAESAEPLKKEYIRHRLPIDFLDHLKEAAAVLERTMKEEDENNIERVTAETAFKEELRKCGRLLKRVDAVVVNTIGGESPLMAQWMTTRRLSNRSVRRSAAGATPTGSQAESTTATPSA
jgi:hypothetical protein